MHSKKSYAYLVKCFNQPSPDSFDVEVKGIGHIIMHSAEADSLKETGLTYYAIPSAKRLMPLKKLAALAAGLQLNTWKHNSTVVSYDEFDSGAVAIIDARLHLLVENIYMQVLVVCDGERVYEIDCFIDPYNKDSFDKITAAIKKRECLQQ